MGFTGRIIKRNQKSTLIYDGERIITLNFRTKHSLGDIIDENDTLLTPCKHRINFRRVTEERERLRRMFSYIKRIRQFFDSRGFEEAITAKLRKRSTNETNIKPIRTDRGYLATSPETEIKKLISIGFNRVYELGFAYRNDPEDCLHAPEFMMLEWYRAHSDPQQIIDDFMELLRELSGQRILTYGNHRIDTSTYTLITYEDTFRDTLDVDISKIPTEELKELFSVSGTDDRLEVLDAVFSVHVERTLGTSSPTVVYNFPPERANLSRIEDGYARRYEIYIGGIELGNCYKEETDYDALLKRGLLSDQGFKRAMAYGLPPTSGIAVGVDRLIMIMENEPCIPHGIAIF